MALLQRNLHLIGAIQTNEIRTDTYDGREHTVVPVIAIMEGVVWPGNAPSPEFVPASVLEFAPAGWNGKPVMMGHPSINGVAVSANSPEIHAVSKIGMIFNTAMLAKKLRMEAWLDNEKIAALGGEAVDTLQRVLAGDIVEVSIGAFIKLLQLVGVYNGKQYNAQWDEIVPDHLALLPKGETGACSVAMGCGTNRVASHRVLATELSFEPSTTEERSMADKKGFMQSLFDAMRSDKVTSLLAAEDLSDRELRDKLAKKLQATVPGFMGIVEVIPGDKIVTFETWTEDWKVFTQSFTLTDDDVKLKGTATEVQPVTRFEPVVASAAPDSEEPKDNSGCGCQTLKENSMKTKGERIEALISAKKTTLPKAFLETCTDAQIDELEKLEPVKEEVKKEPEAPPPAAASVTAPAAETLSAKKPITYDDLPPELKSLVDNAKQVEAAQREGLMKALTETKQDTYTEAELKAMDVKQLTKVAKLAKANVPTPEVDFSLNNGVIRDADAKKTGTVAPPKSSFGGRFAKKSA